MHHGSFRLDIGGNAFTERVVRPWNRLLREAVEPPSLQMLKNEADVALGNVWAWWDLVQGWT